MHLHSTMLSIKLKTERGTFTDFSYLHSTMLSIKFNGISYKNAEKIIYIPLCYLLNKNTIKELVLCNDIYIPLCYLLNKIRLSKARKFTVFTFHYVIY